MGENWVRCKRCHEVFEAADGICPKCGAQYEASVPKPREPEESSFVDRYAGTEFAPPEPPPPLMVPSRRARTPLVAAGVGLVLVAVVVAVIAGSLAGSPIPTPPPIIVVGTAKPAATASPLPEGMAAALAQLSDPNLSAAISINSRAALDARVLTKAQAQATTFEGAISAGNQTGLVTHNGVPREYRIYAGEAYTRVAPAKAWTKTTGMPPYLVLQPLFGLTGPEMLSIVGRENRNGADLIHFRATRYWQPDVGRMALMDLSGFGIRPDTFAFDLWTTPSGVPVNATFSATTKASDGAKLIDVEVTYTFTNVGIPQSIDDPMATPSPSPNRSPSASPATVLG